MFLGRHFNTYSMSEFIQNQHLTPLDNILNSESLKKMEQSVISRHNGFFLISLAALLRLHFFSNVLPMDVTYSKPCLALTWLCEHKFRQEV